MLSVAPANLLCAYHQGLRIFRHGGSTLRSKSHKRWYEKGLLKLNTKRRSKQKKKNVIVKKPLDDVEEIWLQNLSLDNLKVYRRTSFGSFRKINKDNFLEKLKTLYLKENQNENNLKISTSQSVVPSVVTNEKNSEIEDNQLALPYVSGFLIKNMTSFPLLKSDCQHSLKEVLKDDQDEYGKVDSSQFPSVSKILNETMSESSRLRLKMWKIKMIKKLGEEGFCTYQENPEVKVILNRPPKIFIETPRKRKRIIVDLLNRGIKFHGFLKQYLKSGDESSVAIDPEVEGCWKSVEKLLPNISNVLMVEEPLYHPVLMYKGIVDCVASYKGVPCVIEWKKSDKKKSDLTDTYDAPLQLCAYQGALAWMKKKAPLENGLVVVAYTNGDAASVFSMDLEQCQIYWGEWLRRLQSYWGSRSSTLLEQEIEV